MFVQGPLRCGQSPSLCASAEQVEGLKDSQLGNNTFLLSAQKTVVGCATLPDMKLPPTAAPCGACAHADGRACRFDILDFEPGVPRVTVAANLSHAICRVKRGKLPVWIRTVPSVFIHALSADQPRSLQQVFSLMGNSRVGRWVQALSSAAAP